MTEEATDTGPDRPSRHGKLLGEALAAMAEAGRQGIDAPDLCATCAFRPGSIPNQTAGTGLIALNIVLGIDSDDFACHHGMREDWPTKRCVGALLAKRADFAAVKALMLQIPKRLDATTGVDEVRAEFDRWWHSVDPERSMDVYELASAYARAPRPLPSSSVLGG